MQLKINTRNCLIWAIVSIMLGISVYIFDRQGRAEFLVYFMPNVNFPAVFGSAAAYLPSFFHTFSFIVVSCCIWATKSKHIVIMCLLWLLIEVLMECIQHPSIAKAIESFSQNHGMQDNILSRYSVHGTFSMIDITAIISATLFAFVVVRSNREIYHDN